MRTRRQCAQTASPHNRRRDADPKPPCRPPRRQHRNLQGRSLLVPDTVVVGSLHPKRVCPGRKTRIRCQALSAIHFVPIVLQSLQPVPVSILLRSGVAQGGELHGEDSLFVGQLQRIGRPDWPSKRCVRALMHGLIEQKKVRQHDRRNKGIIREPVRVERQEAPAGCQYDFARRRLEAALRKIRVEQIVGQPVGFRIIAKPPGARVESREAIVRGHPEVTTPVFEDPRDRIRRQSVLRSENGERSMARVQFIEAVLGADPEPSAAVLVNDIDSVRAEATRMTARAERGRPQGAPRRRCGARWRSRAVPSAGRTASG